MKGSDKGFTLIELITVMLIVSILAVYVSFKVPSTVSYSISSSTELLRRDIRYTQMLAMSLNASYSLVITSNSYSIVPDPPEGAYSVTMPSGISLTPTTITFDAMGAPSAAASVSISGSGVATNTLTIEPQTGFING